MSKFVFALISFRNGDADSPSLATPIRTGSKPSDSSSPRQVHADVETGRLAHKRASLQSPMENAIVDLREALRERLSIIHDEESRGDEEAHMARLRVISEKIDRLQSALPSPVDPRLAHYLQRRSYDKALEFLEGRPPFRP